MWEGLNYINGDFIGIGEGESFDKINPSDEESLGKFPKSPQEAVDHAVESARHAQVAWRNHSRFQRSDLFWKVSKILEARKDEIAHIITLETGKTLNESVAEVNESLHMAQYAFGSGRMPHGEVISSEIPDKDGYMIRKPKGVIAIIAPFNFPLAIGAFWCAAPALVEGNTVILKPSEDTPMSSQIAAEIYDEAGFPPGVFNLIHGEGETGDLLARMKEVDHICFTGSADVGQHIRKICAESWHKTCSCEMGSKSAVLVFNDAKMDIAVDACVASAFKLSGQRCVSASRLLVQSGVYEDFIESFTDRVLRLVRTGPPLINGFAVGKSNNPDDGMMVADPSYYYGPLIHEKAVQKVRFYNDMVSEAPETEVIFQGERLDRKGFFMTPFVYKTPWRDEPYLKNEVFGPHLAIIPFDGPEDAINMYNDTDFGLAMGIITDDFRIARYCRDNCHFGMGYWNGGSIAAESHFGFGGVKKSGNGWPSAARTYQAVTHEVAWTVNHGGISFPQGMLK